MISDFLSRQRFHRLGLYAEFFRGIPVEYQMAISLPGPDAEVIGVALSRARHDFRDEDRSLLSVLQGPLIAALVRARRRQQAGQALSALLRGGLPVSRTARSRSSGWSPRGARTSPSPASSS